MCSCFGSGSLAEIEHKRRKGLQEKPFSHSTITQHQKETTVRIVHAGGRIEMYQNAIPVYKLSRKYPGMCISRPEVFKNPHESLLSEDDILLPGNKYYVIRSSTVEKLKRRHLRERRTDGGDEPALSRDEIEDVGDVSSEESLCSAGDFFISRESLRDCRVRKDVKDKRVFVPPIQKPPRIRNEPEWEPSLTSIKELSP